MIPDLLHALRFHVCLQRNLLFLLRLCVICLLHFLANLLISLSLSLDKHLNSLFVDVLLKLELLIFLLLLAKLAVYLLTELRFGFVEAILIKLLLLLLVLLLNNSILCGLRLAIKFLLILPIDCSES